MEFEIPSLLSQVTSQEKKITESLKIYKIVISMTSTQHVNGYSTYRCSPALLKNNIFSENWNFKGRNSSIINNAILLSLLVSCFCLLLFNSLKH